MQHYIKLNLCQVRKKIKLGDGRKVFSTFQAIIPARIESTDWFIQTETVDEKIPLLLSKSALKKAQTVLNLKVDWLRMFNEDIDICLSLKRHYAVQILPKRYVILIILNKF